MAYVDIAKRLEIYKWFNEPKKRAQMLNIKLEEEYQMLKVFAP